MTKRSSYVWSGDASCRPVRRKQTCSTTPHTENKMEDEVMTATHLIDLIGQLGQDGDPYDAVFNAIL